MARLAQSMGVGGLRQAIELDLGSAYGPRLKQFSDAFEMPAGASNRGPERRYIVALGFGACAPEAIKAARPPGLSTAKDLCATSPPTVSKTASQLATT